MLEQLRHRLVTIMLLAFLLSGVSGCGEPERLPPEQVLERSIPAMQAVDSFHFTLEAAKPQQPVPGLYITRVDGDVARPDKLVGDLDALFGGIPISVKVIVDGRNQYWTDPASRRWQRMPPSFNVADFFDPSKGIADILGSVKDLSGDGTEDVEGVSTYRLKGRVPAEALRSLSPEVTAQGDLDATLWIAASDFRLRRVRLQGPLMQGEPADVARTITVSDYGKEVKVETPVVK